MHNDLEFAPFVRKPFAVDAIEVTEDNIEELAEFIGTVRYKDDHTPFIQVDRRLIPNVYRVYPGFWMTKMGDNIRCYSKKIFNEQFVAMTGEISAMVTHINAEEDEQVGVV